MITIFVVCAMWCFEPRVSSGFCLDAHQAAPVVEYYPLEIGSPPTQGPISYYLGPGPSRSANAATAPLFDRSTRYQRQCGPNGCRFVPIR